MMQRFEGKKPLYPGGPITAHLKEERVGVLAQLAKQLGLDLGVGGLVPVLQRWVHLSGGQVQLSVEGNAHHVHVVSAVPEGAGQGDEDCGGRCTTHLNTQILTYSRRLCSEDDPR